MARTPLTLTRRGRIVIDLLSVFGIALGVVSVLALAAMFGGR